MATLSSCEISWISVGGVVLVVVFVYFIVQPLLQRFLLYRKLKRWEKTPKDSIVLHGFPAARSIPNISPFILKVETYLRLANLHYVYDRKDFFGPNGKSPWISWNGTHVADSEFIISYLGKQFEKDFNQKASEHQLAVARVVRTMLEEFFVSAILLERMVYNKRSALRNVANIPLIYFYILRYTFKKRFVEQGIARHSQQDVTDIMSKNLKAVSTILGENKYFSGNDEMGADDCGIFGILAQVVWGLPEGSPYTKLINGECSNIKDYCIRIKEKLWPDWDDCLAKD